MIVCSNCECSKADVRCNECSDLNEVEGDLFCTPCSGVHVSVKKYRTHTLTALADIRCCTNCEIDRAEFYCLNCLEEESYYCLQCSELHCKVKSTREHRVIKVADMEKHREAQFHTPERSPHTSPQRTDEQSMIDSPHNPLKQLRQSSFQKSLVVVHNVLDNISENDSILYFNRQINFGYDTYLNFTDTSEFFDMLQFFDFDVLFDKFPVSPTFLGVGCIVLVCFMFGSSSEMVTSNGSSAAFIIGVIAFLRFMQYRKDLKIKHGPKHPNSNRARKPLVRSRSLPTATTPLNTARNHYTARSISLRQVSISEVKEEEQGDEEEDEFKDEFWYKRHSSAASFHQRSGRTFQGRYKPRK